tara:strand:- start:596 stop:820 length:225 start_codon:yes stop_codon:yes gene_type:complete
MNEILERYEKDLNEREEANQRFALGDDGYRLYKAAPELLDALQSFLAAMDSDFHDLMLAKMKAQAAIAKAKGGE